MQGMKTGYGAGEDMRGYSHLLRCSFQMLVCLVVFFPWF